MSKLFMLITSLEGGGAQRVVSLLSMNLNHDIEREVILLSSNNIAYPTIFPPVSLDVITPNGNRSIICYTKYLIVGLFRYKRLIKNYNPDCSISFLVLDNFINILSSFKNNKIKTVISAHIALSMKFQGSLTGKLCNNIIKLLYNRSDIIIAVSEGVKQELIDQYDISKDKISVMYNPVDRNNIQRLSLETIEDEPWFNEDIPIIITVGRLAKQKGHWHLIRAFRKVVNESKCRLLIRGDGELKQYLEKLIQELDMGNYIKILGWKTNPYKYMSRSHIYVSPSLWEALPYVLIEAMTCGCPIISTDCKYGPSEILNNGEYGILIPPPDGLFYNFDAPLTIEEEAMANSILDLLNDPFLREYYSNKSKLRSKDFDLDESLKKYETLITS